jgi:hypothetical protein
MIEDSLKKAAMLIAGIREELASGTEHYNQAGHKLTTEKEILECLLGEGSVVIVPKEVK